MIRIAIVEDNNTLRNSLQHLFNQTDGMKCTASLNNLMNVVSELGTAKPDIIGTLCFILLVTCAVYVTLDLNQPERGLIRINQEPMERLLLSMTP